MQMIKMEVVTQDANYALNGSNHGEKMFGSNSKKNQGSNTTNLEIYLGVQCN